MRSSLVAATALAVILAIAACSDTSIVGGDSADDNVDAVKRLVASDPEKQLALALPNPMDAAVERVKCSSDGDVRAPNGGTFADYVRDTLRQTLMRASVLGETGAVEITVTLDRIELDPFVAAWHFTLTVSGSGQRFTINHSTTFDAAGDACDKASAALATAVEELVHALLVHPGLAQMMR